VAEATVFSKSEHQRTERTSAEMKRRTTKGGGKDGGKDGVKGGGKDGGKTTKGKG